MCERVAHGHLKVQFISRKDKPADVLTKPLGAPKFALLRNKLITGCPIPMSLRGCDRVVVITNLVNPRDHVKADTPEDQALKIKVCIDETSCG